MKANSEILAGQIFAKRQALVLAMFVKAAVCLLIAGPAEGQTLLRQCELALDEVRPLIEASLVLEKNSVPTYDVSQLNIWQAVVDKTPSAKNLPNEDENFTSLLKSRARQKLQTYTEAGIQVTEDDLSEALEYRRSPPQPPPVVEKIKWTKESVEAALQKARPRFDELNCLPELLAAGQMDMRTFSRLKPEVLKKAQQNREHAIKCARLNQEGESQIREVQKPQMDFENFMVQVYFPTKSVQRAEKDAQLMAQAHRELARATAASVLTASEIEIVREHLRNTNPVVSQYLAGRNAENLMRELERRQIAIVDTHRNYSRTARYFSDELKTRSGKSAEEIRVSDESMESRQRRLNLALDKAREQAKQVYSRILKADCAPMVGVAQYPQQARYMISGQGYLVGELKKVVQEWRDSQSGDQVVEKSTKVTPPASAAR